MFEKDEKLKRKNEEIQNLKNDLTDVLTKADFEEASFREQLMEKEAEPRV